MRKISWGQSLPSTKQSQGRSERLGSPLPAVGIPYLIFWIQLGGGRAVWFGSGSFESWLLSMSYIASGTDLMRKILAE